MSHRALVGLPVTDDRVDLYHSQNGANDLKLYPVFEAAISAGEPESILKLEESDDSLVNEIRHLHGDFGVDQGNNPLVKPDPYLENLRVADIGEVVDYIQYEALILPSTYEPAADAIAPVGVYLPVLIDVAVVAAFMHYLQLEVYPRSALPENRQSAIDRIEQGKISPQVSIEGQEFLDVADQPEAMEHLIDAHIGLLQALSGIGGRQSEEIIITVLTEESYIVGRVGPSKDVYLPDPTGKGLLVRLPVEDFPHDQVVNLYNDWQYLVNRLRIEHSIRTARTILAAESPADVERTDLQSEFLAELDTEFGSQISTLSPEGYLEVLGRT